VAQGEPVEPLAEVRERLLSRALEARHADADARLVAARERLERVRERPRDLDAGDDRALALARLGGNLRRAGRGFRAAVRHPTDEGRHEWRKRAKYARHHFELLRKVAPTALRPVAKAWSRLGDGLGDDHDLAVLRAALIAEPDAFGG